MSECAMCESLGARCAEATREYGDAREEYRKSLVNGSPAAVETARLRVGQTHQTVRAAQAAYRAHLDQNHAQQR
jgi:hypothetical protein